MRLSYTEEREPWPVKSHWRVQFVRLKQRARSDFLNHWAKCRCAISTNIQHEAIYSGARSWRNPNTLWRSRHFERCSNSSLVAAVRARPCTHNGRNHSKPPWNQIQHTALRSRILVRNVSMVRVSGIHSCWPVIRWRSHQSSRRRGFDRVQIVQTTRSAFTEQQDRPAVFDQRFGATRETSREDYHNWQLKGELLLAKIKRNPH